MVMIAVRFCLAHQLLSNGFGAVPTNSFVEALKISDPDSDKKKKPPLVSCAASTVPFVTVLFEMSI